MIEIVNYRSIQKNTLQGIFTIKVPKWGNFIICDLSYFVKGNQRWVSLPSRSYQKEGKTKYFSINKFEDPGMMQKFQEKIMESLDKYLIEHKPVEMSEMPNNPPEQFGIPF